MSVNSLTDFNRDVRSTPTPARASSSSSAKADDPTQNSSTRASTTDVIDISPQARAASQAATLNASAPVQNFSVGSGYNAADKPFDQVKQDMRALFDARGDETGLEISSKTTGKEAISFLGDIKDRRALFAVYGDTTGTFTKAEKATALTIMWQQKNDAEFGPLRIEMKGNPLGSRKATIDFLNQASPEEKAVALEESEAYAQAQRDFAALLAAEHNFTFTQTSAPSSAEA